MMNDQNDRIGELVNGIIKLGLICLLFCGIFALIVAVLGAFS